MAKESHLPYYLPIDKRGRYGFMPYWEVKHEVLSRIWTRVSVSIGLDDNFYTKHASSADFSIFSSDRINRDFFKAKAASVLLYGGTSKTLRIHTEKKWDGNYTRILWIVLNTFWKNIQQNSSCMAIYLPSYKSFAWNKWNVWSTGRKRKNELISNVLKWTLYMNSHSSALWGHWMRFRGRANYEG